MRLEQPVELAKYVLRDQPEWDAARIEEAMHAGTEKHVKLKEKIPVYLGYWTARVRPDGTVQFRAKQAEYRAARVNRVEIDLLRSGRRLFDFPQRALAPGQVLCDRFILERIVGSGGTAVVYQARDMSTQNDGATNIRVALKVPRADRGDRQRVQRRKEEEVVAKRRRN